MLQEIKKLYRQKIENYRYQMEILGLKKNGKKWAFMGRFNSRLNRDEDKIINLKVESEENTQIESWRDKNNGNFFKSLRVKNTVTCSNAYFNWRTKSRGERKQEIQNMWSNNNWEFSKAKEKLIVLYISSQNHLKSQSNCVIVEQLKIKDKEKKV